ncbi:hypothetical protein WL05_23595 [Burkholderia ubonensis]|uniref:hypothetical protein n=1 Tax=Burkholderia ubonensis TaxID=101571 RepID=UPI000753611C|nr:hypothetical protein [Burkholderia ubonensis]KVC70241.1 hypothetical protein WI75_27450 [Burkholderia ubonensis]KVD30381.1 hypothetical protein WI82_11060 [Burkholderia ubonensis]KVL71898.1 hypothetical protein WJ48_07295 [Burkholderia ubonensis]KVL79551.1 hypothetical protein WJ49_07590 [Burkholderia ubonensis]KVM00093.1 hypothetical protein WJ50_34735 [Burkholderia ubonensis]
MKQSSRSSCLFAVALITTALSACGGGDDVNTSGTGTSAPPASSATPSSPQPTVQAACRPNGNFTYSGSASQVKDNNGKLAVVVVPSMPKEYQLNRNFTASAVPASSLLQQASGAFTTLASSDSATDCLGLDHGMVSEIQGVGSDVAIGRWNMAKDTDGNTYTMDQGLHYAVGTPLSLPVASGTLACTQLIADSVANDSSGPTGTLGTASATLDLGTHTLNNLSMTIHDLNGQYTLTKAQTPLNGVSTDGSLSVQTVVVGHDAKQPLVALGYSTSQSKSGVGGVVVLSCQ